MKDASASVAAHRTAQGAVVWWANPMRVSSDACSLPRLLMAATLVEGEAWLSLALAIRGRMLGERSAWIVAPTRWSLPW